MSSITVNVWTRQWRECFSITSLKTRFAPHLKQVCIFLKQHANQGLLALTMLGMIVHITLPSSAQTASLNPTSVRAQESIESLLGTFIQMPVAPVSLPKAFDAEPSYRITVPITAYSSEVGQTDSTPFTTASQTHVRDGIVAANFVPIGTRIRIPELYGNKIFVVEDRMNARYDKRVDIWMEETVDARNFGKVVTTIEVFPRIANHAQIVRKQEKEGAVAKHLWSTAY